MNMKKYIFKKCNFCSYSVEIKSRILHYENDLFYRANEFFSKEQCKGNTVDHSK